MTVCDYYDSHLRAVDHWKRSRLCNTKSAKNPSYKPFTNWLPTTCEEIARTPSTTTVDTQRTHFIGYALQ